MKAMILAAGLGTRLRPLTDSKPKALVEVGGRPLLEHVILKLRSFGVDQIIINLHHFGEQIRQFIASKNQFGIHIEFSDETKQLLNTGGGLQKASKFLEGENPFVVYNTDVLSDIDLLDMLENHTRGNALATLAVRKRTSSRYFLFDDSNKLVGWESTAKGDRIEVCEPEGGRHRLSFMGIHVISPQIFQMLTENGSFSIVQAYLRLAREGYLIQAYRADRFKWLDLGRLESLKQAEKLSCGFDDMKTIAGVLSCC